MKPLLTIPLLLLCLNGFGQAPLDTIVVFNNQPIFPNRTCIADKLSQKSRISAIRYGYASEETISKDRQDYYFKGFNKDSVLILEGQFFDGYANGIQITYSEKGEILTRSMYKAIKLKKPKPCFKNGGKETLIYYTSDKEWSEMYTAGRLEIRHDSYAKGTLVKQYDARGNVIKEQYYVKGKLKKKPSVD